MLTADLTTASPPAQDDRSAHGGGTYMTREQFAAYLILRGLSDQTVRTYTALMTRFVDWCAAEGADPGRPDPLAVRRWAQTLHGSRSIIDQARAALTHWCAMHEVDNVAGAIPVPRRPRKPARGLSRAEAAALEAAAREGGQPGLAVLVGLYTAARRGEIASLAWERIDLEGGELTLERQKTRDLHTVPLHPVLAEQLAARAPAGGLWVFPSGRLGGHVSPATIWHWVTRVAETAGVHGVTPHRLRHTALSLANDQTGDLRAVQDLAGHTDPAVTARYTSTSRAQLNAVVDALDYRGGGVAAQSA